MNIVKSSASDGMIENRTFDEIAIGDGASLSRKVSQRDIDLFAVISSDVNPTHMDPAYAKADTFHKIIAHGMLGAGLISSVLGTKLPGPGTIYLGQDMRFLHPVSIGDTITATLKVTEKSLRLETRRFGIRVALIEPGDTRSQLPLRRRTVQPVRYASAYQEIFDRFQAKQAQDEAKAPPPDAVAALVERILRDPRPAMRYSAGMWDQRMALPLKRWLPYSWFERILGTALGV